MIFPNLSLILASVGAALSAAQGPVRPVRIEGAAQYAAKNNKGVEMYLKGDLKGALKLFDEASLMDFAEPVPWINGAIANLDLGRLTLAARAKNQAGLLGDRSIRRLTLSVDLDTARGQVSKAWEDILAGEFQNPDDSYLHLARAKYADVVGRWRMAERSRWQAYRLGALPLVDSKPFDGNAVGFGGGLVSNLEFSAKTRRFDSGSATVGSVGLLTEELGSDSKAKQSLLNADVSTSQPWGTFMGSYRRLIGDRPGPLDSSNLFPSTPGARIEYGSFTAGWQKTWSRWTTNFNFREGRVDLRSSSNAPTIRNNFENQWIAEARYDSGPWTAGGGISDVYRRSVENPVIEPLEEVFGQAHTRLGHAYVVRRDNLLRSVRLITGGALNAVDDSINGFLSGELAVKLFANQYLRIGAKPTMNRVGTSLFPEDLRARSRHSRSRVAEAPLFSPTGKQLDLYVVVPMVATPKFDLKIHAFRKEMTDTWFASGDPDLVSALNLTFSDRAIISGVRTTAAWTPSSSFEMFASATVQSSRAHIPLAREEPQALNVPNLTASLGAAGAIKDWSISVSSDYTGPRIQASTSSDTGVSAVHFQNAPGVWTLNAALSRPAGEGFLTFSANNFTRSSLYPGFGVTSSYRLSYQQRY